MDLTTVCMVISIALAVLFIAVYFIFSHVGHMELRQIQAGYCKICKKDMKRRGKIQDKLEEDMKVAAGIVDKPKKAAKKKSKSTGTLIVPPNTENLKVFIYGGAGSGSSILKIKEKRKIQKPAVPGKLPQQKLIKAIKTIKKKKSK